ncbi:hypothetical protein T484DRAFT_1782245 [Baffinella frigidus]|nr:hypothetical protein T484DRAFT_1782245 [Cryptophyta sp. CCMP2293]
MGMGAPNSPPDQLMEAMSPYMEPCSPTIFVRTEHEMTSDTPPPRITERTAEITKGMAAPNPRKRKRRDSTHYSRPRDCRRESRASAAAPRRVPAPPPTTPASDEDEMVVSPWSSSLSGATTLSEGLEAAASARLCVWSGSDREVGGLWWGEEGEEDAGEGGGGCREDLRGGGRVGGASWLGGAGQQVLGNSTGAGELWGDSSGIGVGLWGGDEAGLCEMMLEVQQDVCEGQRSDGLQAAEGLEAVPKEAQP